MKRLMLLGLLLLGACTPRGEIRFVPDGTPTGTTQRVYVASTREIVAEPISYTARRETDAAFLRVDVSVPAAHMPGQEIVWVGRNTRPDPRRHFLTRDLRQFESSAAFKTALAQDLQTSRRGHREAVVYVHGFNNTFAEGVYRIAQLSHDLQIPGAALHYSWPSRASALGYAYDRDSALFARDGLENLLTQVTEAGADRVLLVAHSMGAALTMETLRQIALRGDHHLLDRIAGVMLMSPDIDVDVFRAQALTIGDLPQPFLIFTSRRDNALALSAFVARETQRLGNLRDLTALAGLDVTVLETGAFDAGSRHFTAATSPALIRLLSSIGAIEAAFRTDATTRVGLLPGAVLTLQGATRIVLDPFATLGEQITP
jgi:esterase/lipase superfamily enzyme